MSSLTKGKLCNHQNKTEPQGLKLNLVTQHTSGDHSKLTAKRLFKLS